MMGILLPNLIGIFIGFSSLQVPACAWQVD
jgi:hypothetical protein